MPQSWSLARDLGSLSRWGEALPTAGGWNKMVFNVPSNLSPSIILCRFTSIKWLHDLMFLAEVFSSLPEKPQSPRKFTSPLLGCVNSSEGTWLQTAKIPFRHKQQKNAKLSLCASADRLWIRLSKDTSCRLILPSRPCFCPLYDTAWMKLRHWPFANVQRVYLPAYLQRNSSISHH